MFTKLWRVDRVLQFRRRKVTYLNVVGPLLMLLLSSLVVLTLWTILDPWTWERVMISISPSESHGECSNDNFWAVFGPLVGLMIVAEVATVIFAWKTSDVPEDLLRETNTVVLAIATHIQAWIAGVPILAVLGTSSANAKYLGRVFLIWIFSVSSVAIVVGPKVYMAMRCRFNPELLQRHPDRPQ